MTREVLTQSELKHLLDYNPVIGVFTWKPRRKNKVIGAAGYLNHGRRVIKVNQVKYFASRLAYLYMIGRFPDEKIDHINHIMDDDRWINIRAVTIKQNAQNRSICSNNKSGVMGVSWASRGNKWVTYINIDKRTKKLGNYSDYFEAVCVRKSAENKYGYHKNHGNKGI
jgi:hypothetical protein